MCWGAAATEKNGSTTSKTLDRGQQTTARRSEENEKRKHRQQAQRAVPAHGARKHPPGGLDTKGSFREVPPARPATVRYSTALPTSTTSCSWWSLSSNPRLRKVANMRTLSFEVSATTR